MQESAVPILVVQEGQLAGKRWPTRLSLDDFRQITGAAGGCGSRQMNCFPDDGSTSHSLCRRSRMSFCTTSSRKF